MPSLLTLLCFVWVGGLSALMIELGRRMTLRRLPPNLWSGIRVSRTLESPETWYAVHEKAGPGMVATAVIGALTFAIAMYFSGPERAIGAWSLVVLAGVVGVSAWSLRTTP